MLCEISGASGWASGGPKANAGVRKGAGSMARRSWGAQGVVCHRFLGGGPYPRYDVS